MDGEVVVQYTYTIGADLISQERNGRTYAYLYDGHGSVVGLMSESGSVTDTYTYDAFGNLLKSTGRTENNYRYCGEQFDSTTGLYYLRARYMDTNTGRFISQDSYAGSTYDPVSLHKYLYANSNPVTYSDPSGYFSLGELSVCSAISSALDTISSNFAMAVWASFIGGFIAVGDQLSTGNLNPKDLLSAFGKGFIVGFAFALLRMFLPVKIMMAISGLSVIGGFAGAVDSFTSGEFWQGIYRTSLSTLGGVAWWKTYGNDVLKMFKAGTGKSSNLKFGSNAKSETKLFNQMKKRGWTNSSVKETVEYPHTTRNSTNLATGNSATVYYNKDGSYVIVDDVTNEIVQVSDCNDPNWIPDSNIENPYQNNKR